ncbi:MAG: PorV/PorQ family protein [candidate division KSB1 bacterium]|nr:PorV/PorQ family protein [candidate division KSB1 bacterium]MDZ7274463.1 PorV/PorQ family protein [candidate division KSB1 bacterium]MDZ7284875.1 PorV/PorQ family protein [candidate division KSB1 bacterium]MDZ7297704.1 PorV/PorQ family protein [candidate division KSB1 bacterium]MDZ7308274.1 PorV/PorQ family protein [candidate division KSB1 bacterium]
MMQLQTNANNPGREGGRVCHVRKGLPAWLSFLASALLALPAQGQEGGTHPLFVLGVGARAIGLGGATVAMPTDATTLYWNPGGLDFIQQKNIALFYTPLIDGTKYHFVGYVHPTLNYGTFGVGWLHWDVGDIKHVRDDGEILSENNSFGQDRIIIGGAKSLNFGLSVGANLKIDRQVISIQSDPTASVAFDLGVVYRPDLGEGPLQDLALGVALENLVMTPLTLGTAEETFPRLLRAGLAKPIHVGGGGDALNLSLCYEQRAQAESRMAFGSEYIYRNQAMLRAGYNGTVFSYGGGVVYQNFQIDYAMGKYANEESFGVFGMEHRVSLTIHFGRTKNELIQLARDREKERIAKQIENQRRLEQQTEFDELMGKGRTYFQQQNYFQARLNFAQASNIFPNNEDALVWKSRAEKKMEEEEARKQAEIAQAEAAKVARADSMFVAQQLEKGKRYFDVEQYRQAIDAWEAGLVRVPNNTELKSWIERTKTLMENRVAEMRRRAQTYEAQGNNVEAIQTYNRLLNEAELSAAERNAIAAKVAELDRKLTIGQHFNQGVKYYIDRRYAEAIESFKRAKEAEPSNKTIDKYIWDAESRLNAREEAFASEEIRSKYVEALRLNKSGRAEEALKMLEEIQRQQRYNKRILDLIDLIRDKLRK